MEEKERRGYEIIQIGTLKFWGEMINSSFLRSQISMITLYHSMPIPNSETSGTDCINPYQVPLCCWYYHPLPKKPTPRKY